MASARAEDARLAAMKDLFFRAKALFRGGNYDASLATLAQLDATSRAPDLAAERERLEPPLAFYRGANLAALGEKSEAKKEFEIYLEVMPAARLDPSMYPRAVLDAFAETRNDLRETPARRAPEPGSLPDAYARFAAEPGVAPAGADERWADGPIRFLLTPDEKIEWRALPDGTARAEFVALFWQRRNPNPEAARNAYREEIERRIAFADARLAEGEKRGSETDRGMVFVLMGPPEYVGTVPLTGADDPIEAARPSREGFATVPRVETRSVGIQGTREIWHYERDRIPPSLPFSELVFTFLTKDGYGEGVLQREPEALTALDTAAQPRRAEP